MTRYFYDTEFIDDGRTIELISIGIVADDGREYYAVRSEIANEFDGGDKKLHERICRHRWLWDNVVPHLPLRDKNPMSEFGNSSRSFHLDMSDTRIKPKWVIANEVREFLRAGDVPRVWPIELWAYYAAYDHVALAQLWGPMMRLPAGIPMWTHDIMQFAEQHGIDIEAAVPPHGQEHNPLDDAKRAALMWHHIDSLQADRLEEPRQ